MTENKSSYLTDEEIITVLKCCCTPSCSLRNCPLFDVDSNDCVERLSKNALDLINRLQADKEALIAGQETLQKALVTAKAEAVKEFVNRLKQEVEMISYEMCSEYQETIDAIDNLVKEMAGEG